MNPTFHVKLESLLNAESMENGSNTPDFMLAKYLMRCLEAFDEAVRTRDDWYDSGKGIVDEEPNDSRFSCPVSDGERIEENPRKGRDGEPGVRFHKKRIDPGTYW